MRQRVDHPGGDARLLEEPEPDQRRGEFVIAHRELHGFAEIHAAENGESVHPIEREMRVQAGAEGEMRIAGQPEGVAIALDDLVHGDQDRRRAQLFERDVGSAQCILRRHAFGGQARRRRARSSLRETRAVPIRSRSCARRLSSAAPEVGARAPLGDRIFPAPNNMFACPHGSKLESEGRRQRLLLILAREARPRRLWHSRYPPAGRRPFQLGASAAGANEAVGSARSGPRQFSQQRRRDPSPPRPSPFHSVPGGMGPMYPAPANRNITENRESRCHGCGRP